jgi:hypothetical protein
MLKLNDDDVFASISHSSRSVILEIIADPESVKLTEKALIVFLEGLGLVFEEAES